MVAGVGVIIWSLGQYIVFKTFVGSGKYGVLSPWQNIGAVFSGGLLVLGPWYMVRTSTSWLRRASALVASTRPVSAWLTTRLEIPRQTDLAVKAFATLRPTNDSESDFHPIIDMPIFLGMTGNRKSPIAKYTNAPALVYLPETPDGPVVFSIDGVCWCSDP
jgi:hypothetical protein